MAAGVASLLESNRVILMIVANLILNGQREGEEAIASWNCENCGHEKEGRCKSKKCPSWAEMGTFGRRKVGLAARAVLTGMLHVGGPVLFGSEVLGPRREVPDEEQTEGK